MKTGSLEIPDNRYEFFIQPMERFNFLEKPEVGKNPLTDHQKAMIDLEVKKANDNPEYLIDFDVAWPSLMQL